MDFLDFIPENVFQLIGTVVGLVTCVVITFQLVKEWRDPNPSSMGITYVVGWLFIFFFWFSYGVRFRALAIWLTNSITVLLQLGLLMVVLLKRRRESS